VAPIIRICDGMRVRLRFFSEILALAGLAGGLSFPASALRPSPGGLYLRARAAVAAGDERTANAGFAALMAEDPANPGIAARAYRQAISAGDMALALRAAHQLDAQRVLPPDARILLVLEQVKARDWAKARDAVDRIAQDRVFGFLTPYLGAWIAFGSGSGDPIALAEGAHAIPMAEPYLAEQRELLLIALGRKPEATKAPGSDVAKAMSVGLKDASHGIAPLLIHVATDFARQQLTPVGMIVGRMAAYAAPDDAMGWIVLAELLHRMKRADLALAALDHIAPDAPIGSDARVMRILLLNESGRHDAALEAALAAARTATAGADDWVRVADLHLVLGKPAEAAVAYARAAQLAEAAHASVDTLWPILLQQGGSLDLAGDWPAAKVALARAYALAPDQPAVLNQFGYSSIAHREDVGRASLMIAKASKLRPDDPAITDSFGWALYLQGKATEAVPLLERAAAGDPGQAEINEHLGDVYWTIGRQYEARYAWRAALITAEEKDRPRLTAKIDTGLSQATAAP